MRAAASLLALLACSCNEVYGLDRTMGRDAAFFDAGIDAPHQCPPIGTPPRFSRRFRQVQTQSCIDFVVARTGRTLGYCRFESGFAIAEGTLYGSMARAIGFDAPGITYFYPRLAPDGDTAIVRMTDPSTNITFGVFARDETAWSLRSQLPIANGFIATAVTSNQHVVVVTPSGLEELVDDGNGFQARSFQDYATLGIDMIGDRIQITADGLRLLAFARRAGHPDFQLLYTDRPNDTAPFSAFVPLPDLDFLADGFMTEDCAHLYFSGLGQVFSTEPN